MIKLSRAELKKLSSLCGYRCQDISEVLENPGTTSFDIALAKYEYDYMMSLIKKLDEIVASDAKRIEVK